MAIITNSKLNSTQPALSSSFIKDDKVKGSTVKVNSLGSIKFVTEVCHEGQSIPKTLREHPFITAPIVKQNALFDQ